MSAGETETAKAGTSVRSAEPVSAVVRLVNRNVTARTRRDFGNYKNKNPDRLDALKKLRNDWETNPENITHIELDRLLALAGGCLRHSETHAGLLTAVDAIKFASYRIFKVIFADKHIGKLADEYSRNAADLEYNRTLKRVAAAAEADPKSYRDTYEQFFGNAASSINWRDGYKNDLKNGAQYAFLLEETRLRREDVYDSLLSSLDSLSRHNIDQAFDLAVYVAKEIPDTRSLYGNSDDLTDRSHSAMKYILEYSKELVKPRQSDQDRDYIDRVRKILDAVAFTMANTFAVGECNHIDTRIRINDRNIRTDAEKMWRACLRCLARVSYDDAMEIGQLTWDKYTRVPSQRIVFDADSRKQIIIEPTPESSLRLFVERELTKLSNWFNVERSGYVVHEGRVVRRKYMYG